MRRNKKGKNAQQRAPEARQEIEEGEMRQMSGGTKWGYSDQGGLGKAQYKPGKPKKF